MSIGNLATMARLDRLTLAIGEDSFGDMLIETARAVGDVDQVIVFAFGPRSPPNPVINAGHIEAAAATAAAARYAADLYRLDPNLDEIRRQGEGPASWFHFAGASAMDEAFRREFLEPCDISDIVSFAVCQNNVIYLVQFLRTTGQHFASAQRWLLNQVGEVIAAHVRKHFSYMHSVEGRNQFLLARVLAEAPLFAATSPRERLVCIGILTGHTSESIAKNLSISINSVLTYRKRLYEKLGISSQNELFVQIIDAMMHLSSGDNPDQSTPPLAAAAVRARRNGRPLCADLAFAKTFLT